MTNYKFDDSDKTIQPVPVVITEGKYEGIKFQYGRIAFDEKDDQLALKFDYNLIDNPNELEENKEFINTLGEILILVLEEEIEEMGEDFLKETVVNENG
jgi:hypothetical protein|tara:strand:+ start:440 stop:736 length:297 start_codon:yes stop_codon:yes gene_type:complete